MATNKEKEVPEMLDYPSNQRARAVGELLKALTEERQALAHFLIHPEKIFWNDYQHFVLQRRNAELTIIALCGDLLHNYHAMPVTVTLPKELKL